MRIISQADLLGDHKEDGLLSFSLLLLSQCPPPSNSHTSLLPPSTTLRTAQEPGSWVSRPSGGSMCSQPYTYTTVHPHPHILSKMYPPQEGTQTCVQTGICMWRQMGHKLVYMVRFPVSKHKQEGRRIRGTHSIPQNTTQR